MRDSGEKYSGDVQQAYEIAKAHLSAPFPAVTLTEGQQLALDMVERCLRKPEPAVCVIAGFAGVGKTFLVRTIAQQCGIPQVITPTGKAALRVRELTGLEACTAHRWMYIPYEDPRTGVMVFRRRNLDELVIPDSRLVILDEASMVAPDLWRDVREVCRQLDLTLVLVGDPAQLPPVMPPNTEPFSVMTPEFAAAVNAERSELTQILRQAEGSPIIRASMRIREGERLNALRELPFLQADQFWAAAFGTYRQNGVVICHRNLTRFQINAGIRSCLGYEWQESPQPGEPLLVLKNNYSVGLFNGETVNFGEWLRAPNDVEVIHDRYKKIEEYVRFGCARVGEKSVATLALEEIHGRLSSGPSTISRAAKKWALAEGLLFGDQTASQLHTNFGYAFTAHKSQGSQWPYALVVLEPSIRLDNEDGRRWMYTALTRAEQAVAIYMGSV